MRVFGARSQHYTTRSKLSAVFTLLFVVVEFSIHY